MDRSALKYLITEFVTFLAGLTMFFVGKHYGFEILLVLGSSIDALVVLSIAFTLFFFRDPSRKINKNPNAILSPADGEVVIVEQIKDREIGNARKIAIFMSPLNVHINRSPVSGEVIKIEHRPGKFLQAFKPESALVNEQVEMWLKDEYGRVTKIVQIAGIIARRIICRAIVGKTLDQGEKYGIIHFGSRVEVIFPDGFLPVVRPGDKVKGGVSILANAEEYLERRI